jgi:CDP-paratose 2-epimerase
VYNIGGSRFSNCSMLEAITLCESIADKKLQWVYSDDARAGDHIWYISDTRKFQSHYPEWRCAYDLRHTMEDIYRGLVERSVR